MVLSLCDPHSSYHNRCSLTPHQALGVHSDVSNNLESNSSSARHRLRYTHDCFWCSLAHVRTFETICIAVVPIGHVSSHYLLVVEGKESNWHNEHNDDSEANTNYIK